MGISTTSEAIDDSQRQRAYQDGYLRALHNYAWWKDGVQYVGCGVKTLQQAIEDFEKGKNHAKH